MVETAVPTQEKHPDTLMAIMEHQRKLIYICHEMASDISSFLRSPKTEPVATNTADSPMDFISELQYNNYLLAEISDILNYIRVIIGRD